MPFLASGTDIEMQKTGAQPTVRAPEPEGPSALDVGAAAERSSNLVGTLYDTITNAPPNPTVKPGFDPAVSIPKGYEAQADLFHDVRSPVDMEYRRQQIDRENQDSQTIQRAGGWGLAAAMAAGATDPLTIASMAIPVGGPTRLIQAGKLALTAGATTAAQELAMQELQVTRTAKDSALNVAGATVLGGVLGAVFRPHLSTAQFDAMGERVHAELNGGTTSENTMGPIDGRGRIVPETDIKYEPPHPESGAEEGAHDEYASEAAKTDAAASMEAQSLPDLPKRNTKTSDAKEDSILQYLAKHPEGLSSVEAEAQGIDKASFSDAASTVGIKRAFRKNGMTFDQAAEALHEQGYPVKDEAGNYSPNVLVDRIADELRGNPQHSTNNTRLELEMAHENHWDSEIRGNLREADPDFEHHDQAQQDFTTLAAKAHEHDPEAVESILEHGADDQTIGDRLREIVAQGREQRFSEYESASSAQVHNEAQGAPGEEAPALAAKGLDEVPLGITEHINPTAESTAGASAAVTPTMRGETIARGAQTLAEGPIGRVSPGGRLMGSPSIKSRKLLQELANLPEATEKNYAGIASAQPVERELWKYEGVHHEGMKARGAQFREYRERIAGEGGKPIGRREFNQEIAFAMRRNDASPIKEVAEAAKQTRAIEFEPLKARAIKAGLLPEGVTPEGADSYLMRQYDSRKISENLTDWTSRLKAGFIHQGVDVAEAGDIAHKVTRNVLGSERGTMDWKTTDGIVPQSGQLKERTLKLPDSLLEPYLNNDIDHVAHSYLRSMAPQVEMTERFGSHDLKDQLSDIRDDYSRMIERTKDDAGKQALQKRMDADIRDITGVRDRLYGVYGQPKDPGSFFVRAGKLLRSENALRLLGGATLSHFPDMANVMMRYGFPRTFSAVAKILTSPEAFQLTRGQAKRMGAALDMTMNVTASMLGDYGSHSQYAEQRVMNKLTRGFTIMTGETPLITAVQALTSTMAQDELIRSATKLAAGKAVDKNLLARTAAAGIDKDMLARIGEQHEKFGANVNGLSFGMSDQWTDKEAASAFESAVLRDAHSVTLRPGAADTPLLMSTEMGKTVMQFKSFAYAASRGVLNPLMQGLAHGDPRAAQALLALIGMGTATYVAKQKAAGQPLEPFDSPRLALEVIDKANLMGWTSEFLFPLLWQAGIKNVSRFGDRDAVETIGGPTAGTIASTYERRLPQKMLGNQEDKAETFNRSDLHFLRRLSPGQNHWIFRNAISDLEDRVGDAFDLPGKSNADRAQENAKVIP